MVSLDVVPLRFCPSKETLSVLNEQQWVCSFSGGKDSTTLVTYIEWLRRIGMVKCETPRLVQSDTEVEFPFLQDIAAALRERLTECGWLIEMVRPRLKDKLYNQIFGRGISPVHPGNKKHLRWCTRSTKIDPMNRFSKSLGENVIQLTGVRWGESDRRDGQLSLGGCAAGGECGLPAPGENKYAPIITWKLCQVIEWMEGQAGESVSKAIPDLLALMARLIDVYDVKKGQPGMWMTPPKVTSLRFGCIGCPAISNEKITKSKYGRLNPKYQALVRIYGIWDKLYNYKSRVNRMVNGAARSGPLRMDVRQKYFAELLDIQRESGVTLVTDEDIRFIHQCWEDKVYPRGWCEADELNNIDPYDNGMPHLFTGVT